VFQLQTLCLSEALLIGRRLTNSNAAAASTMLAKNGEHAA